MWPFEYKGNLTWLPNRTILLGSHGSRAYGTHRPDSDYDYKGVTVAPMSYRLGFLLKFEQAEIKDTADAVIYDIAKFMRLAADCNPTLIEVLHLEDSDIHLCTPEGDLLREYRQAFLSKRAFYTFRGYAVSQLKRVERHRQWLLNPPKSQPERSDFGLGDRAEIPTAQISAAMAEVRKKMDGWAINFGGLEYPERLRILEHIENYLAEVEIGQDEQFQAAARLCGLEENFIELLTQERRYEAALAHWNHYLTWQKERNAQRAELEIKFGYDTKHSMHLIRLLRMAREILTEGKVYVRRPDAEELVAIRNGAWTYERVMEYATKENEDLVQVAQDSKLPNAPDMKALDNLCQTIVMKMG